MIRRRAKYLDEGMTGTHAFVKTKNEEHGVPSTDGDIMTYHAVIGKDLDVVHRTAQVLRDLPPDASYCLITVGLQVDTHAVQQLFPLFVKSEHPKVLGRVLLYL